MMYRYFEKGTPIVPFFLLLLLYSDVLRATPACPIVTQSFQSSANGTTSDPSATGWYLNASNVPNAAYFAVQSHRLKAQTLGGEGVWYSQVFSIAGYTNVQVDAKISSEGTFTSSEYVKVFYKLDGGPETLISAQYGSFGTPTITSPMMTGSTVQIVIRIYNVTTGPAYYYIEKYDVFKETGPCTVSGISVSAAGSNSGVVTCTHPTTTLTASTTATGATTYSWTGPNGYSATGSSITVSAAGTYTVTGTNSAGTGSASVTVTANNSAPDLTATGANMACTSSVVISASSSVSGATYSWTGPGGFTSTAQNPSVTAAGTYTVTVRNPITGCTASTSVAVTSGAPTAIAFWLEDFTLTNGTTVDTGTTPWSATSNGSGSFTYSVQNNEFKTTFTGQKEGVWTSGSISLAGKSNTTMSVDLRSETASSGDAFETSDYVRVYLRINNRADSLIYEDLAGIGNTTTGTSSMTLASGAFNGDSVRVIIRTSNSDLTERYFFDNVKLTGTPSAAAITTSVSGIVTCSNTAQVSAIVSGGTATAYSWTGPNGFTSTAQNPVVSAGGQYTVTATLSGGCTASASVMVTEDKTAPDITASAGGSLTCINASVALSGSSSVSGATYSWTGPNGFTSTVQRPTVSAAGLYTLTVTNPATGCTSTASTTVAQQTDVPANLSVSSNTGSLTLTCTNPNIVLTASSSTPGVSYTWTGPNGFSVNSATATVTLAGAYTLTATHPLSGCVSTSTASIAQNIAVPANIGTTSVPASGQLDCTASNVILTGSSSTPGVTYSWSGPDGFSAGSAVATAITPGGYTLTVTDPSNGCTSTAMATVTQDLAPPASVTATPSNQLTCAQSTATLTGNSTTTGAAYVWSGPGGFSSSLRVTTTTVAGPYTLTVTNPANGCTATKSITVQQNKTAPGDVSIAPPDQLNCDVMEVTLIGSSSTPNVLYIWSGPDDFSDVAPVTTATEPGDYTLTVVNQTNGCSSTATVTVEQDLTACEAVARKATSGAAARMLSPGPGVDVPVAGFIYKVYPNPVNTVAFVDLSSPVSAHVEVSICNSMGVREKLLFNGTVEANRGYKLSIDAGSFTMGVHFCIIKVDGKVYSSKLLFAPGRP